MKAYINQIIKNNILERDIAPLEIILYVTEKCNLRCKHCFIDFDKSPQEDLSFQTIEKLSKTSDPILSLMLTGGEPFLRKDLFDIFILFNRNKKTKVISIISNGTLTNQIVDFLDMVYVQELYSSLIFTISLDGEESVHNSIRNQENVYMKIITTLDKIYNHKSRSKISLGINITFDTNNQDIKYDDFRELITKYDLDFASVNLGRPNELGKYKNLKIENYFSLIENINVNKKITIGDLPAPILFLHKIKEEYQADLIKKIYTQKKYQGIKCQAGKNICVIDSKGDVHPCEYIGFNMGNVKDNSLKEIVNKKENKKFIEDNIIKKKCFCHHECFLSASINLSLQTQLKSLYSHYFK